MYTRVDFGKELKEMVIKKNDVSDILKEQTKKKQKKMKTKLNQPMTSGENAVFEIIVTLILAAILITGFVEAI